MTTWNTKIYFRFLQRRGLRVSHGRGWGIKLTVRRVGERRSKFFHAKPLLLDICATWFEEYQKSLVSAPPRLQRMLLQLQWYNLTNKYRTRREILLGFQSLIEILHYRTTTSSQSETDYEVNSEGTSSRVIKTPVHWIQLPMTIQ